MNRLEKRASAGGIMGILSTCFTTVQTVASVPILLTFWTKEEYGAWLAITAVGGLLTTLDAGHQNYIGNVFNRCWVENRSEVQTVLASAIFAASLIAALELCIGAGFVFTGRVDLLLSGNTGSLSASEQAGLALLSYLIFWCLTGSVGGVLDRLYTPAGAYVAAQWLGILMRLSGFLALLAAVAFGASILGGMLAQIAAWTAIRWVVLIDLRRRIPGIYPWWRGWRLGIALKNFRESLLLTCNGVLDQGTSNGLVLLATAALPPIQVVMLTTIRTVTNVAIQGTSILFNPLAPDFVRYQVTGQGKKLLGVISAAWLIGNTLLASGLMMGVLFLEPLYMQWTRGLLPFDRTLFSLLGTAVIIRHWSAPFQAYLASINDVSAQIVVTTIRAALCLGMVALTVSYLGLESAGWGLLFGEMGGAMFLSIAGQRRLFRLGTSFPWRAGALAAAQVISTATVLAWFAGALPSQEYISILGCLLVGLLAVAQWFGLPAEVRLRLKSLITLS